MSNSKINITESFYTTGRVGIYGITEAKNVLVSAKGDIQFSGSSFHGENVCFYSKTGNISFYGNTKLKGIIYAPNGNVNISASQVEISGVIIAKSITISASKLVLDYDSDTAKLLGSSGGNVIEAGGIDFAAVAVYDKGSGTMKLSWFTFYSAIISTMGI